MESNKEHWETVYATKQPDEVSWTQIVPKASLAFIHSFPIPKTARIIDIGGGDSRLVDYLLEEGFENITVLDISSNALERTKERLGAKAAKVKWLVQDIKDFAPMESFDVWHDRATFHFLTRYNEVADYVQAAQQCIVPEGYAILGTFAENGPERCSGLPVRRYNEISLATQLKHSFRKLKCINEDHITPFQTRQHFLFCSFQKRN
jgi:2-polyprenyl-3-methyl-5-hydroxy-6-metoxy-1,4-benzoquinol methylase